MIIIAGWIDVEPSDRDALIAASLPVQKATREDEPGCSGYVFTVDPLVAGRIHVYENWDSAEDLEAHFRHPNFTAMGVLIRGYRRIGSQTTKYRVDASAPVRNADGVATAEF